MDKFEKLIKASAEKYEAPYSEAAWASLSEKLGPEKGGFSNWAYAGIVAIVAIAAGVWYFTPSVIATDKTTSFAQVQEDENMSKDELNNLPAESVIKNNAQDIPNELELEDKEDEVVSDALIAPNTPTVKQKSTQSSKKIESANNATTSKATSPKTTITTPEPNIKKQQIGYLIDMPEGNENEALENTQEETVDLSQFKIEVITEKQTICAQEEVSFSASIPKLKGIYQWSFGDGQLVQGAYATHHFNKPGNYEVQLNILDSRTKEVVNSSESITITVNELPLNEISYEFDNSAIPRVTFKQKNVFTKAVNWDIKGVHQTQEATFSQDFRYKGNYVVTCSVTNDKGCQSTSTAVVPIENDYNLLAPSAFSPNGDNLNETFMPKALLLEHPTFIMTIYDKNGRLLFETNDASRPWEGMDVRNSQPVLEGSYVWIVQLTNERNQIETYQGQVTITR